MRTRSLGAPAVAFVASFLLALSLTAAKMARAAFQDTCNYARPQLTYTMTRDGGQTYTNVARYEGYQWGGGCWNNDDVDSSPNDPPQTFSRGEGADCSGLVFKTWKESEHPAAGGRYHWDKSRNVHGPYTAQAFRDGDGEPNYRVIKSYVYVMDGFASSGHVGLVFFRATSGADQIVEAKGEAYGTNMWTRSYRSDSSYDGIGRYGWTS
ncbi:MAG: hypothetical protein H0V84_12420 [Actinobacteria bacterium]|nr:hypothetical protein [Actinomycetota bacterium]